MFKVVKHTDDELGSLTFDFGIVPEDALNRILDSAKEYEVVAYEEVELQEKYKKIL